MQASLLLPVRNTLWSPDSQEAGKTVGAQG
jgi:hypothetical protein